MKAIITLITVLVTLNVNAESVENVMNVNVSDLNKGIQLEAGIHYIQFNFDEDSEEKNINVFTLAKKMDGLDYIYEGKSNKYYFNPANRKYKGARNSLFSSYKLKNFEANIVYQFVLSKKSKMRLPVLTDRIIDLDTQVEIYVSDRR